MNKEMLLGLASANVLLIRFFFTLLFLSCIIIIKKKRIPSKVLIIALIAFSIAFADAMLLPKRDLMYNDDFYYQSMALSIKERGNYFLYHRQFESGPFPKSIGYPFMLSLIYSTGNLNPKLSNYANAFFYGLSFALFAVLLWKINKTNAEGKRDEKEKDKRKKKALLGKSLLFTISFIAMLLLIWSNILFKKLSTTGETHVFSVFAIALFIYLFVNYVKRSFSAWSFLALMASAFLAIVTRPENVMIIFILYLAAFSLALINRKKAFWVFFSAILISILCIPNFLVIRSEYIDIQWGEGSNFGLEKIPENVRFFSDTVFGNQWESGIVFLAGCAYSLIFCFWFFAFKLLPYSINKLRKKSFMKQGINAFNLLSFFVMSVLLAFTLVIFVSHVDSNRAPRIYLTPVMLSYVVFGLLAFSITRNLSSKRGKKHIIYGVAFLSIVLLALSSFFSGVRWEKEFRESSNHRKDQLDMSEQIYFFFQGMKGEYYVVTQYPEAMFFLGKRAISVDAFIEGYNELKGKEIYVWLNNLFDNPGFARDKTLMFYNHIKEDAEMITVLEYKAGPYESKLEKLEFN